MSDAPPIPAPPRRRLHRPTLWTAGVLAGVAAGVMRHGFDTPLADRPTVLVLLGIGCVLVLASRALTWLGHAGGRPGAFALVDQLILLGFVLWFVLAPGARWQAVSWALLYAGVAGVLAAIIALGERTADALARASARGTVLRWILASCGLCLVAGSLLALPVFWAEASIGQTPVKQARHWLDCLFIAASALSGTGLTIFEVGRQFSPLGQVAILVLMEIGGLAVLAVGTALALHLRTLFRGPDEPPAGRPPGLITLVIAGALALQAVGAVALYTMWDPAADPHFAGAVREPALGEAGARWLYSAFHAAGALCNVGLTLPRGSLLPYSGQWALYVVLAPLMVLGLLGAVVCVEAVRARSRRRLRAVSTLTRVEMLCAAGILLGATALLVGIESTRTWQLRYPRDKVPGKLQIGESPAPRGMIVFSGEDSERARSERLRTMNPVQRIGAALVTVLGAMGGGVQVARLDEQSLSPAGRFVLVVCMLVGGAVGGTSGGVRILVAWLLLRSLRRRSRSLPAAPELVRASASVLVALLLLCGGTFLLLLYRDVGSVESTFFEAVSACTNAGLSAGLTPQLAPESRVLLILAMLAGRVLPLAILLDGLRGAGHPRDTS